MAESDKTRKTPATGDRVVINSMGTQTGFGGQNLSEHFGKHGVIINNDGCGCCRVKLDDGTEVMAWNGADLIHEDEEAVEIDPLVEAKELLRMWYDRWTGVQMKIATPEGLVQRTKRLLGIS